MLCKYVWIMINFSAFLRGFQKDKLNLNSENESHLKISNILVIKRFYLKKRLLINKIYNINKFKKYYIKFKNPF